ncbi:MAG: metallophosphoesterase [Eubacterium sp.]
MFYVTGDTHMPIDMEKLDLTRFSQQLELTKNDYLIICGDFGGIWNKSPERMKMLNELDARNFTTLWIDGNHENFNLLNSYPVNEWNGGKVHFIRPSIIHLMRGQVFTIDGLSFFTMGGGYSVDKCFRKPDQSWWPQEMPSKEEYAEALENLKLHENAVDYIITHAAKTSIVKNYYLEGVNNELELDDFFEKLDGIITYKHWYCGHIHEDVDIDEKHTILYQKVVAL